MGLLSADQSNSEYLDQSCTKASSRKEIYGSCVWQIEVHDWTADVIAIGAKCRLFLRTELVVVDRLQIRPRETTAITSKIEYKKNACLGCN